MPRLPKEQSNPGLVPVMERELNIDLTGQVDFMDACGKLVELGFNEEDIGLVMGVVLQGKPISLKRWEYWKRKVPEFKKFLQGARGKVLNYAVAKLIRSACGYDYSERKCKYTETWDEEKGEYVKGEIQVEESVKHKHPDPRSLIFLICNLDREGWKATTKTETENKTINLTLDGKATANQIAQLAGGLMKKKQIATEQK